jgi:hypothetical protein
LKALLKSSEIAAEWTTLRGMSQVHEHEFDDDEVEDDDLFGDEAEFDDPDSLDDEEEDFADDDED